MGEEGGQQRAGEGEWNFHLQARRVRRIFTETNKLDPRLVSGRAVRNENLISSGIPACGCDGRGRGRRTEDAVTNVS